MLIVYNLIVTEIQNSNNITALLLGEKLEDTKKVIRSRRSKDRHNGQQKKYTRTYSYLQNTTQKTKYREQKQGVKSGAP